MLSRRLKNLNISHWKELIYIIIELTNWTLFCHYPCLTIVILPTSSDRVVFEYFRCLTSIPTTTRSIAPGIPYWWLMLVLILAFYTIWSLTLCAAWEADTDHPRGMRAFYHWLANFVFVYAHDVYAWVDGRSIDLQYLRD